MPRWRCIDGEVWNVENEPESASGRQRGIKMNVPKRLAIYESPIRSLLLIAATLFVTHTLAMVMFSLLPQLSMWAESLTQSILLLALLFPVLYFVSLRPLLLHIAERQRAEEIMRESEQKYRNLFEHLTDAAFLVDVESGRILDTNSQGERLLGRTRGEIMGMNQSKLYAPGKEKEQREWFSTYTRQERPEDFQDDDDLSVEDVGNRNLPQRRHRCPGSYRGGSNDPSWKEIDSSVHARHDRERDTPTGDRRSERGLIAVGCHYDRIVTLPFPLGCLASMAAAMLAVAAGTSLATVIRIGLAGREAEHYKGENGCDSQHLRFHIDLFIS